MPSAISALGLDSIMPDLVQTQPEEAQRILRVELAPAGVGKIRQRCEGVVVLLCEPAIDQLLRGPLRLGGADVVGLEDGAQDALGGDRMTADELCVSATMQQKYWDHGLSVVVLRIT